MPNVNLHVCNKYELKNIKASSNEATPGVIFCRTLLQFKEELRSVAQHTIKLQKCDVRANVKP